jgi:hypothetical protein
MNPADRTVRPGDLLALAARVNDLMDDISAVQGRLRRAPDEPTRSAGFPLDTAVSYLRQGFDELRASGEALHRVVNRGSCPADWGACPDHGATLRSSGRESWCGMPGCRSWDYDRLGSPCSETATHTVTGPEGSPGRMCVGHAREAATVPGFHVEPPIDEAVA